MNKSYRSIYNEATGAWVAVSETTSARGKKSSGKKAAVAAVIALHLAVSGSAYAANAGLAGGPTSGPLALEWAPPMPTIRPSPYPVTTTTVAV